MFRQFDRVTVTLTDGGDYARLEVRAGDTELMIRETGLEEVTA
jgi:hypothetical protein